MAADDSESDDNPYLGTRMGRTRMNAGPLPGTTHQNASLPIRQFDADPDRRTLGMWNEWQQPTIWDAVNYPHESEFRFESFYLRYIRQSEAQAIIDKPVNDTWQSMPKVHDEAHAETDEPVSDFEEKVEEFFEGEHTRRKPLHRLNVLDRLARLGEYAVMVLGFADGREVDTPVAGIADREDIGPDKLKDYENDRNAQIPDNMAEPEFEGLDDLMYLAVYGQDRVDELTTNTNMRSPRFRLPQEFSIVIQEDDDDEEIINDEYQKEDIHWSRIIHVPEGTLEDDLHGVEALKPVFHDLLNIDKIKAASGEGYWRAGYQGLHVSPPKDRDGLPMEFEDDGDGVHEEITEFINNMDRTLATPAEINSIESSVGNPMPHLEANYQSIAAATDIPKAILTGEDRADTANSEDVRQWHQKIGQRRNSYAGPVILEPLIQRLIDSGILPEPDGEGFELEWLPLDEMSEAEKANLDQTKSNTINNLSGGNPTKFASIGELRQAIGWGPQIGSEVEDEQDELTEDELEVDESALPSESEADVEYPDELFDTPAEAESRADEMGITGYHVKRVDGEIRYAPGEDAESLSSAKEDDTPLGQSAPTTNRQRINTEWDPAEHPRNDSGEFTESTVESISNALETNTDLETVDLRHFEEDQAEELYSVVTEAEVNGRLEGVSSIWSINKSDESAAAGTMIPGGMMELNAAKVDTEMDDTLLDGLPSTFNHELGHARHHENVGDHPTDVRNFGRSSMENPKEIAAQVSDYAAENGLEFVAEVHSGLVADMEFSAEVMQLYEDLGGPSV